MQTRNERRGWIVIAVLLAAVAGQGVFWFLTSAAGPEVRTAQIVAVGLQVVVGLGGTYYAWRRASVKVG